MDKSQYNEFVQIMDSQPENLWTKWSYFDYWEIPGSNLYDCLGWVIFKKTRAKQLSLFEVYRDAAKFFGLDEKQVDKITHINDNAVGWLKSDHEVAKRKIKSYLRRITNGI